MPEEIKGKIKVIYKYKSEDYKNVQTNLKENYEGMTIDTIMLHEIPTKDSELQEALKGLCILDDENKAKVRISNVDPIILNIIIEGLDKIGEIDFY